MYLSQCHLTKPSFPKKSTQTHFMTLRHSLLTLPLLIIASFIYLHHQATRNSPSPQPLLNPSHTKTMPTAPHPTASAAKINTTKPLDSSTAKWLTLSTIHWTDETGTARTWESASRKTRGATGIDAVSIATILKHATRPPATLIILQFRPPLGATCVEFPAGLIDAGETPAQAAFRELREETGYGDGKGGGGVRILDTSPTIGCDPGMSDVNMQVVTVEVGLAEEDTGELPRQELDEGEFIQRVVVPLEELYERLVGLSGEGMVVDARLWHWAAGFRFARSLRV